MKPNEYRESYTVTQDIPFSLQEGQTQGTHSSTGVLEIGRVVWIREHAEENTLEPQTVVYAEGVGLMSLESSNLLTNPGASSGH